MSVPRSSPFVQSQRALRELHAAALHGPQWLADARDANWAALERAGTLPAFGEAWKYTTLKALDKRVLAAATEGPVDPARWHLVGVDGARLVFVDGVFRSDLSDSGTGEGLSIMPLREAVASGADGLCHFLSRRFDGPALAFAQLAAALAGDGAVVRVAPGTRLRGPLHLVFASSGGRADAAWHVRNLVALGEGAQCAVLVHHVGAKEHTNLANVLTQVDLAAGATLSWLRVQDESAGATLIERFEAQLAAGAALEEWTLDLGAGLSRRDTAVTLAGDGAAYTARGAFAVRGRQHADNQIAIAHAARDTRSDVAWRGIADGRARGVLGGGIEVRAGADGADARLSSRNLLLSPHAEIDTRPVLEIHADEVKASHGATVGQLDENALFYLRSRGVPLEQARAMLTYAFASEMLAGIEPAALGVALATLLASHLPASKE